MGDLVYLTPEEKYEAILEDLRDCVKRGQPVLVGTASIETSELVSDLLNKARITSYNVCYTKLLRLSHGFIRQNSGSMVP